MKSAQYFRKGYNLTEWFKNSYEQEKGQQALNEFVKILESIIECERNGSTYLLQSSK